MIVNRMPAGPDEVRRFIQATEDAPEAPHNWALVADECARYPVKRAWFEEVIREMFAERVARGNGRVAVLCNIARRAGLIGLAPFFAGQLATPLGNFSDADIRSLMGAVLELAPHAVQNEPGAIDRVIHHGRRADVFAVAIHLVAAVEPMEAAVFIRNQVARAAKEATQPERIWTSLARLVTDAASDPPRATIFAQALARLESEPRQAFLDATRAYAGDNADTVIAGINAAWRDDRDAAARGPDPRSAGVVRDFLNACKQGDVAAARALLVHPDHVRALGAAACSYADFVQQNLDSYMASLPDWHSIVRVNAPLAPMEPSFAGANLFPFQVELAVDPDQGRSQDLSLVVLEYGDARAIALPVARAAAQAAAQSTEQ